MTLDRSDSPHEFGWHQLSYPMLLLLLLSLAALHPIVEGRFVGERIHDAVLFLLLIGAAFSPVRNKRELRISLMFAIPALVTSPLAWYYQTDGMKLIHVAFIFLLLGYVLVAILKDVFRKGVVTGEKICGAICGYLLIGVIWSFVYTLIANFDPHAFASNANVASDAIIRGEPNVHTYYSFVTLSTLGYGDITPVNSAARTFSWLEAIVGQLYLAVLIARLVGLHIAHEMKGDTAAT